MLKAFVLAGALAALLPAAAQAQPRWQPYYDQGGARYQDRYDDRGYYRDERRYPRRYADPYGYAGVPYVQGHPAYDEYGPDPNGLRAPDGHRIKCKLMDQWDGYAGQYVRRRNCW